MALALINHVPVLFRKPFETKVEEISKRLGFHPAWLMAVMYSESGFKPDARNPNGGATGLIQFMPKTAEWLGTSTTALSKMTAVQQLDWVEKYYAKWGKKMLGQVREFSDLYLLTFYPVALKEAWPNSREFPLAVYAQNRGIDLNGDKKITVGEFKDWALGRVLRKMPPGFTADVLKKKPDLV